MRKALKPGVRVKLIGPSKYEGQIGHISQVNVNRNGSITYFVALEKPLHDEGHEVLELRTGGDRVRSLE